jgi:hypothetical protein
MNNFQGRYEDEVAQEYLDGGRPGFWVAQWPKSNKRAKNTRKNAKNAKNGGME